MATERDEVRAEERAARLEAANRALLDRVRVLRAALLPFARVGRGITADEAARDVWLAHARRAAEVADGRQGGRTA